MYLSKKKSRNSWNKCLTRLIFYFSNYRDLRIHFPLSIYSGHFQPFIDFQLIFVLESSNLRILVALDIPYISLELNVAISQKNSRCTIFDRKRNWTWCPFPCLTTCRRAWLQIWLVLRHWVQKELTLCPRSNGKQKFMKHVLA